MPHLLISQPPYSIHPTAPHPTVSRLIGLGAVILGGATGTLVRVGLAHIWVEPADHIPWPTLTVNLLGSFVLGVLMGTLAPFSDDGWRRIVRIGLGTGMCGGLTTYSTFIIETERLLDGGMPVMGLCYFSGSLIAGLTSACLGLWIGSRIVLRHHHSLLQDNNEHPTANNMPTTDRDKVSDL